MIRYNTVRDPEFGFCCPTPRFISLVEDPNAQFVRVGQEFFALAIICPIIVCISITFSPTKCGTPVRAVPAVPTFWTPEYS